MADKGKGALSHNTTAKSVADKETVSGGNTMQLRTPTTANSVADKETVSGGNTMQLQETVSGGNTTPRLRASITEPVVRSFE
jgi:hypothetical protein